MFEKATNCLTDIDFFGKFYYFTFNKEARYTSACGGVFSMVVSVGFLISLWFLGKEIVFKESPVVVFNYELDVERYNRNMQVPFGFVIENLNGLVLDNYERYFSFSALHINFSKTDITKDYTIIRRNIPMRKCLTTDFSIDPIVQKAYADNNLKYAYCLELTDQVIGGSWGQLWNYYVNVTLEPCKNTTTDPNSTICASDDEINFYITKREIQVSMYYEDMVLTTTNNAKPLTKYMKNDHQRIQLNTAKTNEYFLQDVVVTTDNGWIFPSKTPEKTQIFVNRFYDFYNNNLLLDKTVIGAVSFNFFASSNKYEILRYYLKLQDVLAQLGGVLKVVFMAIEGFLYLIYSHKHEEILIRSLYRNHNYTKHKNDSKKNELNVKPTKMDEITITNNNNIQTKNEKKIGGESILNTSNQLMLTNNNQFNPAKSQCGVNDDTTMIKTNNNNEAENNLELVGRVSDTVFNKKLKDESRFIFSYQDVILIVFMPCIVRGELKKKERLFRTIIEHTKKYSDGLSIIRGNNELEKLKHVIFDDKQLALFSLLSDPKNPLDSFEGELRMNSIHKERLLNADIARNYLGELKLKRTLTHIEKRLLELNQR